MNTEIKAHCVSSEALTYVLNAKKRTKGGIFTIKSKRTGKDYTYKIRRSFWNDQWYTHVYVEYGHLDFNHLGTFWRGEIRKKGQVASSPSAKGIAWVLNKVDAGQIQKVDEQIDLMHTGTCIRCGKTLTDALSIEIGIGPVCRKMRK